MYGKQTVRHMDGMGLTKTPGLVGSPAPVILGSAGRMLPSSRGDSCEKRAPRIFGTVGWWFSPTHLK